MVDSSVIGLVVIGLLLLVIVFLWMLRNHQIRADVHNEEQGKQFRNMESMQIEAREAQLRSLGEMQNRLEQRFADVQKGLEQRLGEMSSQQVEKLASSNEQIQETLHKRLNEISGQVEQRLNKGKNYGNIYRCSETPGVN